MANLNLKPLPKLTPDSYSDAAAVLEACQDCRFFCREVLGYDAWSTQERIMQAISKPYARVAVKAAHSTGKTSCGARIVLWFILTGGICITTAPTWAQVELLLWKEIHEAHESALYKLGGTLLQTKYNVDVGAYGFGLSTNEAVRFQGFHARKDSKMLVLLDEAPGVKPAIWEAIEGIRTGGDVRILAQGNPVIGSGPFYNAFNKDRAIWQRFTIDAFDTPNLAGCTEQRILQMTDAELNDNPRPYLVTRRAVKERYLAWGPNSPIYQSRIRGCFPQQADDALMALDWLELARVREMQEPPLTVDWWAGVDVAGPGEDETVVTVRHGDVIKSMHWFVDRDPRANVLAVLEPYRDYHIEVNVDSVGQGYYFAQHIKDAGFSVHEVSVGKPALDDDTYVNMKAETYWALRERFQTGRVTFRTPDVTAAKHTCIITPPIDQLDKAIEQLSGLRYEQTDKSLIRIERKEDAVKRGMPSPDGAESIMLAFHNPTAYEMGQADEDIVEALQEYTGW